MRRWMMKSDENSSFVDFYSIFCLFVYCLAFFFIVSAVLYDVYFLFYIVFNEKRRVIILHEIFRFLDIFECLN